jgi:hypothetical protein
MRSKTTHDAPVEIPLEIEYDYRKILQFLAELCRLFIPWGRAEGECFLVFVDCGCCRTVIIP